MEGFDDKDRLILRELEADARVSSVELSKKTRLSKRAVLYRIKRLEEAGAISEYLLVADAARLGWGRYEVWFRLKDASDADISAMAARAKANHSIYSFTQATLNYDLMVGFMARDVGEFRRLLDAFLDDFGPFVISYDVSVVEGLFDFGRRYLAGPSHEAKTDATVEPAAYSPERPELGALDVKILEFLRHNGREKFNRIAQGLGITEMTLRQRIRRLREKGVIIGFKAHVHPALLGAESFEALLSIRHDRKREEELLQYCARHPRVNYFIRCIAKWDLDIAIEVSSVEEFQKTMSDIRKRFSDILLSYETVAMTKVHFFNHVPPLMVGGPAPGRK